MQHQCCNINIAILTAPSFILLTVLSKALTSCACTDDVTRVTLHMDTPPLSLQIYMHVCFCSFDKEEIIRFHLFHLLHSSHFKKNKRCTPTGERKIERTKGAKVYQYFPANTAVPRSRTGCRCSAIQRERRGVG